jgi:6-phosphofructokinase 1
MAGGADVILLPEIAYDVNRVAETVNMRSKAGKKFSIIVVAEGAMSCRQATHVKQLMAAKNAAESRREKERASTRLAKFHAQHVNHTMELTKQLEKLTGLESRLTILGHLQRGGSPSCADRLLATKLGSACVELLDKRTYGIMVGAKGDGVDPVSLEKVAGKKKLVQLDHYWMKTARSVGTSFGD